MFIAIWRYTVPVGQEERFQRVYAPDGQWAQLFGQAEGYLGTELLADATAPLQYITIDRWQNAADFQRFKSQFAEDYQQLDTACAVLKEHFSRAVYAR